MNKIGTLMTAAVLTLGVAAGAMAVEMPKTAGPVAADAASSTSTDAPTAKKHKKHKKPTFTDPTTSN